MTFFLFFFFFLEKFYLPLLDSTIYRSSIIRAYTINVKETVLNTQSCLTRLRSILDMGEKLD